VATRTTKEVIVMEEKKLKALRAHINALRFLADALRLIAECRAISMDPFHAGRLTAVEGAISKTLREIAEAGDAVLGVEGDEE
jgi:purine nucleoside permease